MAWLIVAGLVGNDHARQERREIAWTCNPLWAFVHGHVTADSVARAVAEIESILPQKLARDRIKMNAVSAFGEAEDRERDMTFQHQCKPVSLLVRGSSDRDSARHVRRAVQKLPPGVNQIK